MLRINCQKKILILCVLFTITSILYIDNNSVCAAQHTSTYALLKRHEVLENYMLDLIKETAQKLVRATDKWSGVQINSPHSKGYIHIYISHSERLPSKGNILYEAGINLLRNNIQGGVMCHNDSKSIFIDSQLLKDFISHTFLVYYKNIEGLNATAMLKVKGIDAFSSLWDSAQNPDLSSRAYRKQWLIAFRGMLGFVIGHELGHIALNIKNIETDNPASFNSKEDMDIRWACPEFIGGYREKQELERQADNFCVELLRQFNFPDNQKPQLLYELGGHSYFNYEMQKNQINALFHTSSPFIRQFMQLKLDNATYSDLLDKNKTKGLGSVQIFFPKSHPATVQRIHRSLSLLTRSPYSAYYGEEFGIERPLSILNDILRQECARLSGLSQ